MNPLVEGRKCLASYCHNILMLLEQALEVFYRSSDAGQVEEKAKALQQMKKLRLQLLLLEPFYRPNDGGVPAQKLQKICVLLAKQRLQADSDEELHLLISFYCTLAELARSE